MILLALFAMVSMFGLPKLIENSTTILSFFTITGGDADGYTSGPGNA